MSGVSETFLEAFKSIRADAAYNSPLINLLFTGNRQTTEVRPFSCNERNRNNTGSVASLLNASHRVAADVTAGLCTAGQIRRRILDIHGFDYSSSRSLNLRGLCDDSNDFSFYNGLEFIMGAV